MTNEYKNMNQQSLFELAAY